METQSHEQLLETLSLSETVSNKEIRGAYIGPSQRKSKEMLSLNRSEIRFLIGLLI